MDGAQQLRAGLDEIRRRTPNCPEVVIIDNGSRGPNIIDTRGVDAEHDVVDGLVPAGVIAALSDLDDPAPTTLLENGFDVVLQLQVRDAAIVGQDVLLSTFYHPRLGRADPAPFLTRFNGSGWDRV